MSLAVRSLWRYYNRYPVLRNVNLDVEAGQWVALLGGNGTGKTTLLRTAATLGRPDKGTVTICGHDTVREPIAARKHIGFVPHNPGLYPELTAMEHLQWWAKLHHGPACPEMLGAMAPDAPASTLSRGQQQRLAIALALQSNAPLLLLDEPFTGLDLAGRQWLQNQLQARQEEGAAILMSVHEDAQAALADRTVRLTAGQLEAP